MNASFEEKSVWIQLLGLSVGLGLYFVIAALMMAQGIMVLAAYVPLFIAAVILLVVVLVAGSIIAALTSLPHIPEQPDERDRIMHSMLLSQVVKLGFQLLYYRRGM